MITSDPGCAIVRQPFTTKHAWLVPCLTLALTACNTDRRCQDINLEEIRAHADQLREQDMYEAMENYLGAQVTNDSLVRLFQRRYYASQAAKFRVEMRQKYPTDTFLWRPPADPARDSAAPSKTPPPRPSDREWYAEHCFEGRAR